MRRALPVLCLLLLSPTLSAAQPQLAVSPTEVPSGGAVTVTVTGTPGLYWALIGSFRDNGLVYGGAALAVGTDVQILGNGFFDPSGTVNVPFVPPLGNGVDAYFLQAVSSASPDFIPLTASAGIAVRPRGLYANAPSFSGGLGAGGARITGVAMPAAPTDAANKAYVDLSAALLGPGAKQSKASGTPLVDLEQTGVGDLLSLRVNATNVGGYAALLTRQQFRFMADGGFVARGDLGIGIIPASGQGERLMWHPYKAALRAGSVSAAGAWDDANVGFYTFATGYDTRATAVYAVATGDSTRASNTGSTAHGGHSVAAGVYSLAAGFRAGACGTGSVALGYAAATANAPVNGDPCAGTAFPGSFVFGDNSTSTFLQPTANQQFAVRAAGGYRLYTNAAMTTGVSLNAGGSSWNVISDRRAKYDIRPLDEQDVLRRLMTLPLSTFLYKDGDGRRYMGPMAQDFHAAFGLGDDDTRIAMNDIDGVSLASLKALGTQVQQLRDENAALKAALEALAAEVAALAAARR